MQCSVCQHDTLLVIGIVHGMSFVNQQLAESLGYGCVGVILRAAGGSHYYHISEWVQYQSSIWDSSDSFEAARQTGLPDVALGMQKD